MRWMGGWVDQTWRMGDRASGGGWRGWALAALAMWALVWSQTSPAEELQSSAEAQALCAFSAPLAEVVPGSIVDPLVLSAGRRNYLFERTGRLFGVYSVRLATEKLGVRIDLPALDVQTTNPQTHHPDRVNPDTSAAILIDTTGPLVLWAKGPGNSDGVLLQLSAPQLTFEGLTQEDSARIALAHRAGLLALEIDFWLNAPGSEPYCEARPGQQVLKGVGLEARLRHTGSQEVWAVTTTEDAMVFRARFAPDAASVSTQALGSLALQPRVEVTRVECLGDESGSGEDCLPAPTLHWLQNEIEAQLLRCYATTLRAHGRRQGALSLRLSLPPLPPRLAIDIDALDSEPIATCALAALADLGASLGNAPSTQPALPPNTDLGLVVIFKANKQR